MAYCSVKFIEKGVPSYAVVPTNWIKNGMMYWSTSLNAKKHLEQRVELGQVTRF